LIPVRAGDRVKTDRRDAKRLVALYRGAQLSYVAPPTPETEGLRDLMRCRDDLRRARTAARHGSQSNCCATAESIETAASSGPRCTGPGSPQRLDDDLAQAALQQMLIHLDGLDRQLDALDRDLEQVAQGERWAASVEILTRFRGIATRTALGLIAEIGDFTRFSHPRELCAWLGIVPSKYSSGAQRHRGHITKTGNNHARRLLIEAAWSYRYLPRRPRQGPEPDARAWQAQIRLHRRYRHLTEHGKRSTVAIVAVARELAGFLWAATTNQPLLRESA
jgi:transposase